MKTGTKKRSHVAWSREWEVRELNHDGDAIEVDHHATESKAIDNARALAKAGAVATVVEYHVARYPSDGTPDRYTEIVAFGDEAALKEFGWEGKIEKA